MKYEKKNSILTLMQANEIIAEESNSSLE